MKTSGFAMVAGASSAFAAINGFNYGAQENTQSTFETSFKQAASLQGTNGEFNSARLYTMIQEGTASDPTNAIPAAIDTKTTLLLGLWASQDQAGFNNELAALKTAITNYNSQLKDLVVGISVGSEDLYRITPTGIENKSGYGQSPSVLVEYINQVKSAIKGTVLDGKLVGHVDTWNAFTNGSNSEVITACDFLGLDEYPYFQTADANAVSNGGSLFFQAFDAVQGVAQGKEIWVTEAGWPVSGPTSGQATASVANAEEFYQDVFCELQNRNINTWWYTLNDQGASPSFGVSVNGQPLYDLSCKASSSNSSSSSTSSSTTSSSSGSSTSAGASTSTGSSSSSGSSGSTGSSSSVMSSPTGTYTNGTSGSSGSSTGTGSSAGAGPSSGSGSGSSGSGSGSSTGSSTGSSSSASSSPQTNGAGKVEGAVALILVAAAAAVLL